MLRTTTTDDPSHELDGHDAVESLFEQIETVTDDDTRARLRREVVLRTQRVADVLAHRYVGRGLDVQDLEQVARCALVVAVGRYRPGVGRGFLAFAVPTITGELKRHFRDCGWTVRPPRRLQELRSEVGRTEDELRARLRREPRRAELASALGVPVEELDEARGCGSGFRPLSLESPTPAGGTVGDGLPDSRDGYERWMTSCVLRDLVAGLPQRDRLILSLRFDEGRTQTEIGEVIGVSQMQVSRLLARIVGRLREGLAGEAA